LAETTVGLREAGWDEADRHPCVHRPWGWAETLATGERFRVKRLKVRPGAALSLQIHHHRAEHWTVVCGTARVHLDGATFDLAEDQSTYIPVGAAHRLENPGPEPLEVVETQTGSYLGEDDIIRLEAGRPG
jgi:mannose-6-phosphate isomerase-like protein (cupin superfamily)